MTYLLIIVFIVFVWTLLRISAKETPAPKRK